VLIVPLNRLNELSVQSAYGDSVSTVFFLRKNPMIDYWFIQDSSKFVLWKGTEAEKEQGIQYCKDMGYTLYDETDPSGKRVKLAVIKDDPFRKINGEGWDYGSITGSPAGCISGVVYFLGKVKKYMPGQWTVEQAEAWAKQEMEKMKAEAEAPPTSLSQTAIKRHKRRPKSHVGKMEGAYNAPGATNKMDTRLTPVHRYVLETNFPILIKQ
jgi:hypothetical protein